MARVGTLRVWCLWALLGLSLAGCGTALPPPVVGGTDPTFPVPISAERQAYLQNFPVLDQYQREAPPLEPQSGRAPFGVLIYLPTTGSGEYCSASHIAPGLVATAEHCISDSRNPNDYFVLFYDKRGQKTFSPVASFYSEGKVEADDLAIVMIPPAMAELWDVAGPQYQATAPTIGQQPPQAESVQLWTFDPIRNYSQIYNRFGRSGMLFVPKICAASRTLPQIYGAGSFGSRQLVSPRSRETIHFFLDTCDRPLIQGNSGSLVSVAGNFAQKVGIYHWGRPPDDSELKAYSAFYYLGNSGSWLTYPGAPPEGDFFGIGSAFDSVAQMRPRLF